MNVRLDHERHAAIALRDHIKAALGEDEQALLDAIEGQTNFIEIALRLADEIHETEGFIDALGSMIKEKEERKDRLEMKVKAIRRALATAILDVGLPTIKGPAFTISARLGRGGVDVVSPDMLPPEFWRERVVREWDKTLIKAAMDAGEQVAGAVRTNGTPIVTIRST